MSLFEKHRPTRLEDVVGQEDAVKTLKRLNVGGMALLLAGPSGSGKTTLARIVAHTVAEEWHVEEIDALDCNLDYLRGIEKELAYRGLGAKQGKVWIVNEVHGLRGAIVSRFLTLIERLPSWATVIFTTTKKPQAGLFQDMDDADPFFSRCTVVPMAFHWATCGSGKPSPLTIAFAARARQIAVSEGLDGKPMSDYVNLALSCKHNLRQMLSKIEAGAMAKA